VPATDFAISPIRHRRRRDTPIAVGAVAVLVLMFLVVGSQLQAPDRVDRLTIVNPTDHGVRVSVRATPVAGRYDLGWAWEHGQLDVHDAADVGGTWIFRFSYAGLDAGELTITRADLEAAGWRIEVPAVVGERLTDAGIPPAYHDAGLAVAT
jgi:hypothetical protein